MFDNCQNFAGSWGRNFVGNWFVALITGQLITLLNFRGDVNFWVGLTQEINKH